MQSVASNVPRSVSRCRCANVCKCCTESSATHLHGKPWFARFAATPWNPHGGTQGAQATLTTNDQPNASQWGWTMIKLLLASGGHCWNPAMINKFMSGLMVTSATNTKYFLLMDNNFWLVVGCPIPYVFVNQLTVRDSQRSYSHFLTRMPHTRVASRST